MNNAEDPLLIEYLRRDSEFSRRYKTIEAEEAPIELDNLIIAQAAQSVTDKSRRHKQWRTWSAPLAMAATIVLTISILIQSNNRAPPVLLQAPTNEIAEKADYIDRKDNRAKEEDKRSAAPAVARDHQPVMPVQIATLPQPSAGKQSSQASTFESGVAVNSRRDQSAKDAPASIDVASPTSAIAVAPAMPAGAGIPEEKSASTALSTQQRHETLKTNEVSELEETIVTGSMQKPSAAEPKLAKQIREADPTAWLQFIRELRMAGKNFSANGEWRRFKKAYPDYVVADDDSAHRQ